MVSHLSRNAENVIESANAEVEADERVFVETNL